MQESARTARETREAADQVLSLPIYPSLTPIELERIAHGVNALAEAGA